MSIDIQVVSDPAQVCAEQLSAAAATGGHVILTGGSTPKHAYQLAAAQYASSWAGAKLWFSDDRCVEPTSELSNYGLIHGALLEPLAEKGVSVEFCRRILGEKGYEEGAAEYERALHELGGGVGPRPIEFELALIGIGGDGHICSMFPGQPSLNETERLVVGVPVAGLDPFVPRVTLTFPALALVKRVVVLATGQGKADAVSAAFAEEAPLTHDIPASLMSQHVDQITVLLDEEAASRL